MDETRIYHFDPEQKNLHDNDKPLFSFTREGKGDTIRLKNHAVFLVL